MKEAVSVITSAWSVAFIVLFFGACAAASDADARSPSFQHVVLVLFALAVTGAGWLVYRSNAKD